MLGVLYYLFMTNEKEDGESNLQYSRIGTVMILILNIILLLISLINPTIIDTEILTFLNHQSNMINRGITICSTILAVTIILSSTFLITRGDRERNNIRKNILIDSIILFISIGLFQLILKLVS
ncbi:hypothetical protein SH1V18_48210 [Vallitalea longa]|uniref:Uncharacterized protein n=1 Tax=Vallitalea longa TaxID=2936439 RepID=A0A9W6DGI7_9FIRM|nr:hypothetical protein [Vallitalea longa]GKX32341.1 hypothetical protein SH1V18_48210 [Vallitalea longa]